LHQKQFEGSLALGILVIPRDEEWGGKASAHRPPGGLDGSKGVDKP
jgi:hypothetical protein